MDVLRYKKSGGYLFLFANMLDQRPKPDVGEVRKYSTNRGWRQGGRQVSVRSEREVRNISGPHTTTSRYNVGGEKIEDCGGEGERVEDKVHRVFVLDRRCN